MNGKILDSSKSTLENMIDAMAEYLAPPIQLDQSTAGAELAVELASTHRNVTLRFGLSELFNMGYFGEHDPLNGYVWTLATWNCRLSGEHWGLAETQQYYEFLLSSDEQAEAIRSLERILPQSETPGYIAGDPFNSRWWGWEDDAIPARPSERDFKAQFEEWLADSGYTESEIADIVARRPPSDGPTRMERIGIQVDERMRNK